MQMLEDLIVPGFVYLLNLTEFDISFTISYSRAWTIIIIRVILFMRFQVVNAYDQILFELNLGF